MSVTRERDGWLLVEQGPQRARFRVLLLPGLQGSDLVFSKLLSEETLNEAGVHLIAGNPPGFKGLPAPAGFDYSVESYAGLVETLAGAEKIDLIVGHSFAGNVLIEVAARGKYKGKVMVISPSLDRDAESKDLKGLDSMSRKPVMSGLYWWLTYKMMRSVFAPYFDDQELLSAVVADGKKMPRGVGRKILVGFFDHIDKYGNLAKRLTETKIPVYYSRGDKDDIGFTDAHRAELETNKLISVHTIPEARHFAMVDNPSGVADLIIRTLLPGKG
jgi:pimeloyl-ACP methyl ester carboxylesterase